jgi:cytochrome c551/c552
VTDIQWFRLMLGMLAAMTLAAGAVWSFETVSGHNERNEAASWAQRAIAGTESCVAAHPHDAETCVNPGYESIADGLSREASERESIADTVTWFMWAPQIALLVLFYGVRWAIVGKVRPLWLLRRT